MEGRRHAILSLFCLALIGSHVHAMLPAEDYWQSVWPNTPMPKTLRDLAQPGLWMKRNSAQDKMGNGKLDLHEFLDNNGTASESSVPRKFPQNLTIFFLEQDLQASKKMSLQRLYGPAKCFYSYETEAKPEEADTSTSLLELCENSGSKAEDNLCATSLESLVNFCISKLGKNIRVLPTEMEKENQKQQEYSIGEGVEKVGERAVVCHKLKYPYAVFYCHDVHRTRAYRVPLVSVDGTKTKALAVCHTNTSGWNPKHMAFQILEVKPGTVPVCHFLAIDSLLWVPS